MSKANPAPHTYITGHTRALPGMGPRRGFTLRGRSREWLITAARRPTTDDNAWLVLVSQCIYACHSTVTILLWQVSAKCCFRL